MLFTFRSPKKPTRSYPGLDLDKLLRSTNDALVHGQLLLDDRQVVEVQAGKRWAVGGEASGCTITIADMPLTFA